MEDKPPARQNNHEEMLRALIASLKNCAIFTIDPEERITSWNIQAERMLGWSEEEIIGQHFSKFYTEEEIKQGFPDVEIQIARAEGRSESEVEHIRKNGTLFLTTNTIIPLRDNEGNMSGFLKIICDITERKKAEKTLIDLAKAEQEKRDAEYANRMKDEFISILSHELRNPLAPITNALQLLRHGAVDEAVQERLMAMLERQVKNLTRLIDDLMDISRMELEKIQLKKEPVDFLAVIRHAIEAAHPLILGKRQELQVHLPKDQLWAEGDPVRLEQAVINLINNAVKYTDQGGSITIRCIREGTEAILRIRDTGIGIDPEMLQRIFGLFTQVVPPRLQRFGGIGVGLALVKNILRMHRGSVSAFSEGPRMGSEFVVRLPLSRPPGKQEEPPPPAQEREIKRKVLVVDDNTDSAESTAMLLESWGHEVARAYTGQSAIDTAFSFRPGIIFIDLGLPDIDGIEAVRRIRQEPSMKRIVFAAITGYGQEEDRQRSKEAGFDFHIVKPIMDEKLLRQILDTVK